VAASAPAVVVVARAVVAVVVDTFGPSTGLDGVPSIAVGPKTTLDRRCHGSNSLPVLSMLEGVGFRPWADGAPAHPRYERWREAELSACCAAAASSNAFSCWRTRRFSEVVGSGQPRSSMASAARLWDTHRKSGGASASVLASTFAPLLARRLLSRAGPRAGGVGARPCG
jgi:hypothetical protein